MKRTGMIIAVILCCLLFVFVLTGCESRDAKPTEAQPSPEPEVTEEAVAETAEAEEGSVPVWKFFHALSPDGLDTAVITCFQSDCEEGPIPQEITAEEAESIRNLAINGHVTDLASDLSVTGGTWIYTFETPEGEHLLSIEMYKGMLVGPYGMYNFTSK